VANSVIRDLGTRRSDSVLLDARVVAEKSFTTFGQCPPDCIAQFHIGHFAEPFAAFLSILEVGLKAHTTSE
jgi:hypothetical protein